MAIIGYYINGYSIDAYWLFFYMVAINGYSINGYWWVLVVILLMVIGGYYIVSH